MEHRYRMRSADYRFIIEAPYNHFGLLFMLGFRKNDRDFKYQRIKDGIQAYPSKLKLYQKTSRY